MEVDESALFGSYLPPPITTALPSIRKLSSNAAEGTNSLKLFFRFATQYTRGASPTREQFLQLAHTTNTSEEECHTLVMAMISVVRFSVKRKFKAEVLVKEWAQLVGLPAELHEFMLSETAVSRSLLEQGTSSHKLSLPTLDTLLFRIDISISTSSLSRAMKPSVPMQMQLSDGTVRCFEMSIEQVHEMRFDVARLLKSMGDMEAHSIVFKIDD